MYKVNKGIDLSNGKRYTFELKAKGSDEIYSSVTFKVVGLTTDEEIKKLSFHELCLYLNMLDNAEKILEGSES